MKRRGRLLLRASLFARSHRPYQAMPGWPRSNGDLPMSVGRGPPPPRRPVGPGRAPPPRPRLPTLRGRSSPRESFPSPSPSNAPREADAFSNSSAESSPSESRSSAPISGAAGGRPGPPSLPRWADAPQTERRKRTRTTRFMRGPDRNHLRPACKYQNKLRSCPQTGAEDP